MVILLTVAAWIIGVAAFGMLIASIVVIWNARSLAQGYVASPTTALTEAAQQMPTMTANIVSAEKAVKEAAKPINALLTTQPVTPEAEKLGIGLKKLQEALLIVGLVRHQLANAGLVIAKLAPAVTQPITPSQRIWPAVSAVVAGGIFVLFCFLEARMPLMVDTVEWNSDPDIRHIALNFLSKLEEATQHLSEAQHYVVVEKSYKELASEANGQKRADGTFAKPEWEQKFNQYNSLAASCRGVVVENQTKFQAAMREALKDFDKLKKLPDFKRYEEKLKGFSEAFGPLPPPAT